MKQILFPLALACLLTAQPAQASAPASKKAKSTKVSKKSNLVKPLKGETGEAYIARLMSMMTLEEKIGQLNLQVAGDITTGGAVDTQVGGLISGGAMGGVFNLKGVDKIRALQDIAVNQSRLGIPLIVGMDVIHGYETIFPIPLAMAATWDADAVEKASAIAVKEATADGINWVYSPMVDICREARWGRTAESNGEDPYLGSILTKAYIYGYQGRNPWPLAIDKAMACVKHFALYGAVEGGRDYNTVDMSHLSMYNGYFEPYKAAVEAQVGSVMSSFNLVDGVPATTNAWLLNDVLRKQWKFDGFVATDYGSVGEVINHGAAADLQEASVKSLVAGTDMDMCSQGFLFTLKKSLEEGKVSQAQIDEACRRVLEAKWRMGLFEDPYRFLNPKRRATDIYTDENRNFSRDIAAESFVLLRNQNNILPLKKNQKIALIGPMANDRANVAGTWCVAYTPERYATVKEAMERAVGSEGEVLYAQGSNLTRDAALQTAAEFGKTISRGDDEALKAEAIEKAKQADVIVCAMGECADMSGESSSRGDLYTPDVQLELLKELKKLGKPIVMLQFSGRATIVDWESQNLDAIMNVWFGGSEAGDAICDVLFGQKEPGGRLPVTMPKSMGQLPIYYNHLNTGRPVPAHTDKYHKYASNYLDVRNDALYPFGFGLTYTQFSISAPRLSAATMKADGQVTVSVDVKNTGSREGSEIVQLYLRDRAASIARPVKELKGFERVSLQPGESKTVNLTIDRDALKFYDAEGREVVEPGKFDVMVGANSDNVKSVELTVE